jgi:hypothetical protein
MGQFGEQARLHVRIFYFMILKKMLNGALFVCGHTFERKRNKVLCKSYSGRRRMKRKKFLAVSCWKFIAGIPSKKLKADTYAIMITMDRSPLSLTNRFLIPYLDILI